MYVLYTKQEKIDNISLIYYHAKVCTRTNTNNLIFVLHTLEINLLTKWWTAKGIGSISANYRNYKFLDWTKSDDVNVYFKKLQLFDMFFFLLGFPHNPYNGVICNDTITATGVFASSELWALSKGRCTYQSKVRWKVLLYSLDRNAL